MLVGHLTLKVILINELMLLLCLASSLLQWSIWLHSVPLLVLVLALFVRRVLPGRSLAPWYFDSSNSDPPMQSGVPQPHSRGRSTLPNKPQRGTCLQSEANGVKPLKSRRECPTTGWADRRSQQETHRAATDLNPFISIHLNNPNQSIATRLPSSLR